MLKINQATVAYVVRGHWPFPVDMLRYDGSAPATAADAALVERLSSDHAPDRAAFLDVEINLVAAARLPFSSAERWESFGWEVPGDPVRVFQKQHEAADAKRADEERVRDAAPDMLAALQSAEPQLAAAYGPDPDNGGSLGSKTGLAALRDVRAAIAKATRDTAR